jgi:predicted aspartyl protease
MGTFRVDVTLWSMQDPGRRQEASLLVDAGATYTTLPRGVTDALGCRAVGTRRVLLADRTEREWPFALVLLTLEG